MAIPADTTPTPPVVFRGHLYSTPARAASATLAAMAMASLPAILALVLSANDPPITPPVLVRLVLILTLLPGLGAWLIRRACAATFEIAGPDLVARRSHQRIEIPCAAIAHIAPWQIPLPEPGFALWLRSGRRLPYGIGAADPTPLLDALGRAGQKEAVRAAVTHPTVVYAHAKQDAAPRPWHWVGKFVVFALVPTAVLFNAHQHIAYGGTLGEYHLLGLGSYLRTFAVYWLTVAIYLVLYASVWRGLAEGIALLAARAAPSRAARMRRVAETLCNVVYYGGVPVLLGLRFLE